MSQKWLWVLSQEVKELFFQLDQPQIQARNDSEVVTNDRCNEHIGHLRRPLEDIHCQNVLDYVVHLTQNFSPVLFYLDFRIDPDL